MLDLGDRGSRLRTNSCIRLFHNNSCSKPKNIGLARIRECPPSIVHLKHIFDRGSMTEVEVLWFDDE